MKISDDIVDRIRGAIFGQAIGDALGLGTEFLTKDKVKHWYPNGLHEYDQIVQDRHRENWKPGEWTDDTDQMLCILDSLVVQQKVDIHDIAERLHNWAFKGGRGLGQTVLMVLSQENFLKEPQAAARKVWEESGCHIAANGAVMRTSVLGIWQYYNQLGLCLNAEAVCKITHFDPRCVASCIAVSLAVSRLIQGVENVNDLIDEIAEMAEKIDARIAESFTMAKEKKIASLELDGKGIGYTLKATASGFWALRNCDSFESGLEAVIHEGGDADTNAAVAGALLGARTGYNTIPDSLKNNLIGKENLWKRTDRLIDLINEVRS